MEGFFYFFFMIQGYQRLTSIPPSYLENQAIQKTNNMKWVFPKGGSKHPQIWKAKPTNPSSDAVRDGNIVPDNY